MWRILKIILLWVAVGIPIFAGAITLIIYLGLPEVTKLKSQNPKTTALMLQRYREAKKSEDFKIQQQWISFEKIPNLLKDTIRITEDAGFYQHKGVDLTELKEAIKKNWEKGKYVRGASTISQQLAKNLYLSTEKNIVRKIREFFIARRLETHLSKNRIYHLYLNLIEFGPGIFGVQAASKYYFNKDVRFLNLEEIVRLTAVISKPLKENPIRKSRWLKWKAGWILDALLRYGYINQIEHDASREKFK
jgi:monofunctional biosynthetic peptidoglycan transglycosylase